MAVLPLKTKGLVQSIHIKMFNIPGNWDWQASSIRRNC